MKHIDTWIYWLGLVSAVIALTMRGFNAFGAFSPGTVVQGSTVWYMSFYKGALLFLLINIATGIRIYSRKAVSSSSAASNNQVAAGGAAASKSRSAAAGA